MTALLQMVENANESGHPLPFVRMRDENSEPVEIHTQEVMRSLLHALSHQKNVVESSHNLIMKEYQSLANARDNNNNSIDIRLQAAQDAIDFLNGYAARLAAAIAAYDPHALPTDLDDLRTCYVERIEAIALARAKYIRGSLTEQANKLPPSCDDEATALQNISAAERRAAIAIQSADDAAGAKAAYDAGVTAIGQITGINTPVFTMGGAEVTGTQYITGPSVVVFADHPSGATLTDPIGLGVKMFDTNGRRVRLPAIRSAPQPGQTMRGLSIQPELTLWQGHVLRFDFGARNICGPSDLTVHLTVDTA